MRSLRSDDAYVRSLNPANSKKNKKRVQKTVTSIPKYQEKNEKNQHLVWIIWFTNTFGSYLSRNGEKKTQLHYVWIMFLGVLILLHINIINYKKNWANWDPNCWHQIKTSN